MKSKGYYSQSDLYYSTVYGSGIYEWNGQYVQDPLCGDNGEGHLSPLLTNIITGEQFFVKRFSCNNKMHNCYRKRILTLPVNKHILWPSDMITLSDEQQRDCSLFVAQEYTPTPTPNEERIGSRALLFPYGGYPLVVNGIRKLSQIESPNWKIKEIRQMAVEIVRALESINRSGYFYTDIHLSRVYFNDDGSVYLDFSNLIFSFKDAVGDEAKEVCHLDATEYPIEFADPAVVRGLIPNVDFHSQNYSVCALFFYLFLGQYAYDGRLLTGYADDTIQTHYMKFRDYHKMPVFIFDPKDDQNALGAFFEEQQVIDLWNELPDALKTLFIQTLSQGNAERTTSVNNPTPSMWLKTFEELGWCEQKGNGE